MVNTINEDDVVVGFSNTAENANVHAFSERKIGVMVDLNGLPPEFAP